MGALDGVRAPRVQPVVLRWGAVALLAAPLFTAGSQLGAPVPFDWGLWATESVTMGWFWAVLVAAPAAVGIGAALGVRRGGSVHPAPGH